jgi:hypothetical protein
VTELVEIPLDQGGSIPLQADVRQSGPVLRWHGRDSDVAPVDVSVARRLADLRPTTRAVPDGFRSLTDRPHRVEVELVIRRSADTQPVVARTDAEPTRPIVARWNTAQGAERA